MTYEEFLRRCDKPTREPYITGLQDYFLELQLNVPGEGAGWQDYSFRVMDQYGRDGSDSPRWNSSYNVASNYSDAPPRKTPS